jgi:hypothetical protein
LHGRAVAEQALPACNIPDFSKPLTERVDHSPAAENLESGPKQEIAQAASAGRDQALGLP